MPTIISHERIVWSTCGVGLFTNVPELIEAYRFKLLKSLVANNHKIY